MISFATETVAELDQRANKRRSRCTLVGPRRLLYVMTLPCHMQGGRRPSGRGFVRNRVHRAAGEGVPGLSVAIHVRVSAGHRFTGRIVL